MVASETTLLLFSSNVKIKQVFKERVPASYYDFSQNLLLGSCHKVWNRGGRKGFDRVTKIIGWKMLG